MNNVYEETQEEYTINTDKTRLDVPFIHHYLSTATYWAAHIPLDIVKTSIANSICFGLYAGTQQIGFARVITDKATFGYLADVFIIPEYRGKGLAKWMMAFVHAHPELQTLRGWMLATRDAHALYKQFGYVVHQQPERVMRKGNPVPYKAPE